MRALADHFICDVCVLFLNIHETVFDIKNKTTTNIEKSKIPSDEVGFPLFFLLFCPVQVAKLVKDNSREH